MKGEARMDCVLTIWSSSSSWMSSNPRRIDVPVSRHAMYSNCTPVHSTSILSSVFSSEYSLEAFSDTSSSTCMWSSRPSCSARVTLKLSSALTAKPTFSLMRFQWRSRRPGLRSAAISGMCVAKADMRVRSSSATLRGSPLSALVALYVTRCHCSSSSFISSALRAVKGPSIHTGNARLKAAHVFHMDAYGSKLFDTAASSGYSVKGMPKICSRWL